MDNPQLILGVFVFFLLITVLIAGKKIKNLKDENHRLLIALAYLKQEKKDLEALLINSDRKNKE